MSELDGDLARRARNESLFREVNERIEQLGLGAQAWSEDETVEFFCECASVRGEQRSHALLVASELITNAISHGSRTGDVITVEFAVQPRRVRICVRDPIRRGSSALVALS